MGLAADGLQRFQRLLFVAHYRRRRLSEEDSHGTVCPASIGLVAIHGCHGVALLGVSGES